MSLGSVHKTEYSLLPQKRSLFVEFLLYLYFGIAFFEPYLSGVLDNVTRYLIIVLAVAVIFNSRGFKL